MISHEHQCIFIHIPKCAGTSIERALGHFDQHSGRGGQDHRTIRELEEVFNPSPAQAVKDVIHRALGKGRHKVRPCSNPNNRLVVTREQYERYYKFSLVRNPWARVFSWYKNIIRDEIHRKNYKVGDGYTFKRFLHENLRNRSLRPQTDWLKSQDGEIRLDFIGRFETLQEDFAKVLDTLGLRGIELPHVVRGSGEGYAGHYDQESIELVANAYREEIELFGYSFHGG